VVCNSIGTGATAGDLRQDVAACYSETQPICTILSRTVVTVAPGQAHLRRPPILEISRYGWM
jgi:hypothetical protein